MLKEVWQRLLPTSRGYQIDFEVLAGVDFANQQEIMQLKESISSSTLIHLTRWIPKRILRQFIRYMHPNGLYLGENEPEPVSKFPMVKQQSVIFIRQRSEALLKEDLKSTIRVS